jgi:hypothetical protein
VDEEFLASVYCCLVLKKTKKKTRKGMVLITRKGLVTNVLDSPSSFAFV